LSVVNFGLEQYEHFLAFFLKHKENMHNIFKYITYTQYIPAKWDSQETRKTRSTYPGYTANSIIFI